MISNKWKKYINSLQIKKYRKQHQAFLVEGEKSVLELVKSSFEIEKLFVSEKLSNTIPDFKHESTEIVSENSINGVSSQKNNKTAIAIAKIPENKTNIQSGITFVLDDIQDPGNLGTIVRIADWFGIDNIVCSDNSVDFYNPKTISATKGSFSRIQPLYLNIEKFLSSLNHENIFGADMNGDNLSSLQKFENDCVIIFGNEANGLSEISKKHIKSYISIPKFGDAESLNVAISTAIFAYSLKS